MSKTTRKPMYWMVRFEYPTGLKSVKGESSVLGPKLYTSQKLAERFVTNCYGYKNKNAVIIPVMIVEGTPEV